MVIGARGFCSPGPKPKRIRPIKKPGEVPLEDKPHGRRKVDGIAYDVDWPPTELVGERNPNVITRSLLEHKGK